MNTSNKARKAARRKAALAAFLSELQTLSSDEIRERLAKKRIRSDERRALAENVLRNRERDAGIGKEDGAAQESHVVEAKPERKEEPMPAAQSEHPAGDASSSRAPVVGSIAGKLAADRGLRRVLQILVGLGALGLMIWGLRRLAR